MRAIAAVLALLALLGTASAEPGDEPRPDQASGVETEDEVPVSQRLLVVPRAVLWLPRSALWVVAQPVRGAAYAYERYDLPGRFRSTFFNVDGTFGIYPVVSYATRDGVSAGARVVHRDLFGQHERLGLRADFGGIYRQAYGIDVKSGHRFGRVALELGGGFERRPHEKLYGIGDAMLPEPVEFREDAARGIAAMRVRITRHVTGRTSGAVMVRQLDGAIADDRVRNVYVEQELAYDSRRPASIYESDALDGAGWLLSGHAGGARGIAGDGSRYARVGGEVQRYFDLYGGSRTLALRARFDAVIGEADRIPFTDLPRLGGSDDLRGHERDRFRDRAVALGTAEYAWDVGNFLAGFLFVDVGRAFHATDRLDDDLHLGFGGGVQVHTTHNFVSRLQVASSREGDVFVELALSPALGRRERTGRL